MTTKEFRALLDWYMCSDPWPVEPDGYSTHQVITDMLDNEARERGFDGVYVAYHEVERIIQ
ncbi:MAG: hypothetical protein V3W44_10860 [Dehalococcoidales bacterium]